MRKTILPTAILISGVFIASLAVTSCGSKKEHNEADHDHMEADSTHHDKMDSTQMAYACPMHPEVTGKDGDKCSKCGMKLEQAKTEKDHDHH